MKTNLFRLIIFLLCALAFVFCVGAKNECGKNGDNVYYELDLESGHLEIKGNGEMADFDRGAPWSDFSDEIKSIKINEGVSSIGESAFDFCRSLESIIIPDSVKSIGRDAFLCCFNLCDIKLPDSIVSIGYGAFENTGYYKNTENWEDDALYIGNHLIRVDAEYFGEYEIRNGTITIADYAFDYDVYVEPPNAQGNYGATYGASALWGVTIPNSVVSIGSYAFRNCVSISEIIIPNSVRRIGNNAFEGCHRLKSLKLPKNLQSIGKKAFSGCSELSEVVFANKNTVIYQNAFENCESLKTVKLIKNSTADIHFKNKDVNKVYIEDKEILIGDVNGDSVVDVKDGVILVRYVIRGNVEIKFDEADCNCDGEINGKDFTTLRRFLAKWNFSLS